MKKVTILAISFLFFVPSVSFAASLTQAQANSLIAVVQSSPGIPASAFTNFITAFSNITVAQADSLIGVVQASPGVVATSFTNLLTSFTADTPVTQTSAQSTQINPVGNTASYTNSCHGVGSPSCSSGYSFVCPSTGIGYCAPSNTSTNSPSATSVTMNTQVAPIFSSTSGWVWPDGSSVTQQQANEIAIQKQQMVQSDEQQIQQEKTVVDGIDLQIATCNAKAASIANQINNPNGAASTMDQLNGEISMQETANTANCTAPAESQLASEELKLNGLTDSLQIAESIVVP